MSNICKSCGFETRQSHFTKCIQCGAAFEISASAPAAIAEKKADGALLAKAMIEMQVGGVKDAKISPEKSLVYWGYFMLFLPMILDAVNGRQPYPEGMIGVIYMKITILFLPIGLFVAHLCFFREREKIGAISGLILSCFFMIIPLLFLGKYWKSVDMINEVHASMVQTVSQIKVANKDEGGVLPILTYDKNTMIFKQVWNATDENNENVTQGYDRTVHEIKNKLLGNRDYAKMFMYGLSYEIVLNNNGKESKREVISRKDVQDMFLMRK